jgi:hypothetical protein
MAPGNARTCFDDVRPIDVALTPSGTLQGRLIVNDHALSPHTTIELLDAHGSRFAMVTDEQNRFAVAGLKGGVYQLVVGNHCRVVRIWTADAAPPSAAPHVEIDLTQPIARGQYDAPPFLNKAARMLKHGATKPLVVGSVLAVAVGENMEREQEAAPRV